MSKDLLVWVDLETTGLDEEFAMQGMHKHKILEVGLHITDSQFNIVDEGLELVIHHNEAEILTLMCDYVRNFHTQNGLLERVKQASLDIPTAEKLMIEYLEKHGVEPGKSPICGNSVALDKNFLLAQMPTFCKQLHYRKMDVSSFKEVLNRLYPEKANYEKKGGHRALGDIKESIAEMKFYMENFLPPVELTKKLKM